MKAFLALIADFLGRVLSALLPALGKEIRTNSTIQQKGNDHETKDSLDADIWDTARRNPPRR